MGKNVPILRGKNGKFLGKIQNVAVNCPMIFPSVHNLLKAYNDQRTHLQVLISHYISFTTFVEKRNFYFFAIFCSYSSKMGGDFLFV